MRRRPSTPEGRRAGASGSARTRVLGRGRRPPPLRGGGGPRVGAPGPRPWWGRVARPAAQWQRGPVVGGEAGARCGGPATGDAAVTCHAAHRPSRIPAAGPPRVCLDGTEGGAAPFPLWRSGWWGSRPSLGSVSSPEVPPDPPSRLQLPPPREMEEELSCWPASGADLPPRPRRGPQKVVFPLRLSPRAPPGRGRPWGPGLGAPGDAQGCRAERVRRPCLLRSPEQGYPLIACRPWGQVPQPAPDPACRDSFRSSRPNARCVFTPGRVSPAFSQGPFSPPRTGFALHRRKDCFRLRVVLKFSFQRRGGHFK